MQHKFKILILLPIILCCNAYLLQAQKFTFKGIVVNEKGEEISFVNVFCIKEAVSTHTNEQGFFELKLNSGLHEIRLHSIDYQSEIIQIDTKNQQSEPLRIVLKQRVYELKELNILSNNKHSADYIMRKAIACAPYYYRQVLAYQAKVYIKGSGKVDKIPFLLKGTLRDQNIEEGVTMLTESVNELSFSQPSTYKERVISLKSSYKSNDGPQPMSMIRGNWYSTRSTELISPLSPQAFSVYKFELLGSFYDEGREVNQIKIIPKRKGRDLYEGTIYIIDGLWCLHTVDVKYQSNSIDVSTKIRFEPVQSYNFVWLPQTYDFHISGSFFGVSGSFRYLASISNYRIKLNPNLDHSYYQSQNLKLSRSQTPLDKTEYKPENIQLSKRQKEIETLLKKEKLSKFEMLKLSSKLKAEADLFKNTPNIIDSSEMEIDSMATKKDSTYWNETRPIVLMDAEVKSYEKLEDEKKDTFPKSNKYKTFNFILYGDSLLVSNKHYFFSYQPLFKSIGLNAIDAWGLHLNMAYGSNKKELNNWRINFSLSIPFERKALNTSVLFDYCSKPYSFRHYQLELGSVLRDFNSQGAERFVDAFYILFYKRNMVKMYQDDYIKLNFSEIISRGLKLETSIKFSNRTSLSLNPRFLKQIGNNSEFNFNQVQLDMSNLQAVFVNHQSLLWDFLLSYQPKQYYRIKNGRRLALPNNQAIFSLNYKQGIPNIFNSVTQFKRLEFSIRQEVFPFHWLGLNYQIKSGWFLDNSTVFVPEYFHQAGNLSWVFTKSMNVGFMNLPFYSYSNTSQYQSILLNSTFKRLLLLRLPFLNLTRIKENLFFNAIKIPEKDFYYELGYGLSNISQVIDMGVFSSFEDGQYKQTVFRMSISIPGFISN